MAANYDLVVIGAGPACGPAARRCCEAGWRVAVVEAGRFGGVCPNTGCNPKKVLLSSPEVLAMARHLQGKGLSGVPTVDWTALMAFKRGFVAPISDLVEDSYRKAGIDIYKGRGVLTGPQTVRVGETELTAGKILLAVGAKPQAFDFPGAEHLSTSDDFLDLDALPGRIVFVGGGFIAFELGYIAASCGAEVTILTHGDKALRRFDQDVVERLLTATQHMGITVRLNAPLTEITRDGHGLRLRGKDFELAADMAVNASGRPAALDGLGLDAAGVIRGKGGVTVNAYMQSLSNPHVYAAGDCVDGPFALTPMADMESRLAAENMLTGNTMPVDRSGTPGVLFTIPPLAMAGLTEDACRDLGIGYDKTESYLSESFPWQRLGETAGFAKVLVSKEDGTILGAHIFGHNAEEMINILALAIRQRIPAQALREGVWAYPTCGYYVRYVV